MKNIGGAQLVSQPERVRLRVARARSIIEDTMAFPIKTCAVCGEEFELKPGKPGFANRCPQCSEDDAQAAPSTASTAHKSADDLRIEREANAERRRAMRNLLYRKDS